MPGYYPCASSNVIHFTQLTYGPFGKAGDEAERSYRLPQTSTPNSQWGTINHLKKIYIYHSLLLKHLPKAGLGNKIHNSTVEQSSWSWTLYPLPVSPCAHKPPVSVSKGITALAHFFLHSPIIISCTLQPLFPSKATPCVKHITNL